VSKCWKQEKSNWREIALFQPKPAQFGCTGLSGGAPDNVRCARLALANSLLSGIQSAAYGYNSPDYPVCTGLSGEPTVGQANGRLRDLRETRGRANGREGAPDCPVCTGQCPVRQQLPGANGQLCHRRKEIRTGQCPVRQATEGKNCLPGMHSTAPSCLGAIKGTPRRMEEYNKHSLSIPKH
jgi:hypothetical protein